MLAILQISPQLMYFEGISFSIFVVGTEISLGALSVVLARKSDL